MKRIITVNPTRGFTLVELLTAMVMLAILAALAVPSFSSLIRNNALTHSSTELITAINVAKSEAVSRGGRVILCKRNDTACDDSAEWEDGWIVFADTNGNNSVDAGEEIRYFEALKSNQTLRSSAGFNWMLFQSRGQIQSGAGGFPVGGANFNLCAAGADAGNLSTHSRALSINGIGRVSVSEGASACP